MPNPSTTERTIARRGRSGGGLRPEQLARLGECLRTAFDVPPDAFPSDLGDALRRLERAMEERSVTSPADAIRDGLMAALPALRRFAVALTRDANRADDLVQDTVVRAWDKAEGFKPGTNLQAWLFTILRNLFYSEQRKRKREVEDIDGMHSGRLATLPAQDPRVEVGELRSALRHLPDAQREALLLVGVQSLSYEEAARICGVAVGTMKSRVSRARAFLIGHLGMDASDDLGVDARMLAAMPG